MISKSRKVSALLMIPVTAAGLIVFANKPGSTSSQTTNTYFVKNDDGGTSGATKIATVFREFESNGETSGTTPTLELRGVYDFSGIAAVESETDLLNNWDVDFDGDLPTVIITDRVTGTEARRQRLREHEEGLPQMIDARSFTINGPLTNKQIDTSNLYFYQSAVGLTSSDVPQDNTAFYSRGDVWRIKNGDPNAPGIWVTPNTVSDYNTEKYTPIEENGFLLSETSPLSTFSIDVDTASYSNVRQYLEGGMVPPKDAVRVEELINYFKYDYPEPTGEHPISVSTEVSSCPWDVDHRLVRIGVKGKTVEVTDRPPSNLVFLIDVSGSMNGGNKIELVQSSLKKLAREMNSQDRISIVVYAGAAGMVLPPTSGANTAAIQTAIDNLKAGGSTNGGEGIQLAYKVAKENFIKDGINRVMLATDGDFNVGTTNTGELTELVAEKAKDDIYLTVLGFGRGNLNDALMEEISNKGNGNYAYIDQVKEADKVLLEQMSGTLLTIAKDVKIQVEFNPTEVQAYRLIGYENRLMAAEDFNDDTKDAGEMGSGHTVTALYEVIPFGVQLKGEDLNVAPLKYQETTTVNSNEMLTVKVRYKNPKEDVSKLLEQPLIDKKKSLEAATDDFILAACAASYGMMLRDSTHKGVVTPEILRDLASISLEKSADPYKTEFLSLISKANEVMNDSTVTK